MTRCQLGAGVRGRECGFDRMSVLDESFSLGFDFTESLTGPVPIQLTSCHACLFAPRVLIDGACYCTAFWSILLLNRSRWLIVLCERALLKDSAPGSEIQCGR